METMILTEPIIKSDLVLLEIQNLNFDRIKFKLSVKEDGEIWSKERIDFAEEEYKRFLTLIKLFPKKSIVPSKIMDEFWHMHILDTGAYRDDCQTIFGRFIDHFPYFGIYGNDDRNELMKSFEETKVIYFEHFNMALIDSDASRCEGKPCHAPTSCKCR
tara:strand:+ start:383 stop:859 length:477 start_codon:yes stop_codon:yes gene_type:complete